MASRLETGSPRLEFRAPIDQCYVVPDRSRFVDQNNAAEMRRAVAVILNTGAAPD
jgi:hypothetical protein